MGIEDVGNRLVDLSDIPEDLKKQLSASKVNRKEQAIIDVIELLGGYASINELLAHLYYQNKIVEKRSNLSNKIYRMIKDGDLYSVESSRGVYASDEKIAKTTDAKDAGTRLGDTNTLPKELKSIVIGKQRGGKDATVIDIIDTKLNGYANTDEIIILLFRLYNIREKKVNLANRIYRLIRDGRLYNVKGKRGVYTTKKELSA